MRRYAREVGFDPAQVPALRLLCWIVHSRSDRLHLEMEAAGPAAPGELRTSVFAGLFAEELRGAQDVER